VTDEHQVYAIMATAICDCHKDNPERRIDPEEAKLMAKCIVAALTEAGLAIVAATSLSKSL
jgi:hypothetical protein